MVFSISALLLYARRHSTGKRLSTGVYSLISHPSSARLELAQSEARTEYLQSQSQSWESYLKNIAVLGYRIHVNLKEAHRLHEQVQVVLPQSVSSD